ncbi:zinc-binding domain-containing protein [Ustulina deusta]|nr:zinc-binding domain-containing protein [Ustulina deusta]
MARKNKPKEKTSSMHPLKHPEVSRLLEEDNLSFTFNNDDDEDGCIGSQDSAVMGRFRCHNPKCEKDGWGSRQIAICIRLYRQQQYNAVVYHQHCKKCDFLAKPILDDDTYAERVAYWLKKWSGIRPPKPPRSNKRQKPHEEELCEGCQAGHCQKSSQTAYSKSAKLHQALQRLTIADVE